MTLIDMSRWQGRIDAADGEAGHRWHQTVRAYGAHGTPGPGVALVGFASDAAVARNRGRTGGAEGPGALRSALALGDSPAGGPPALGIVNFDAHGDLRRPLEDGRGTSGTSCSSRSTTGSPRAGCRSATCASGSARRPLRPRSLQPLGGGRCAG